MANPVRHPLEIAFNPYDSSFYRAAARRGHYPGTYPMSVPPYREMDFPPEDVVVYRDSATGSGVRHDIHRVNYPDQVIRADMRPTKYPEQEIRGYPDVLMGSGPQHNAHRINYPNQVVRGNVRHPVLPQPEHLIQYSDQVVPGYPDKRMGSGVEHDKHAIEYPDQVIRGYPFSRAGRLRRDADVQDGVRGAPSPASRYSTPDGRMAVSPSSGPVSPTDGVRGAPSPMSRYSTPDGRRATSRSSGPVVSRANVPDGTRGAPSGMSRDTMGGYYPGTHKMSVDPGTMEGYFPGTHKMSVSPVSKAIVDAARGSAKKATRGGYKKGGSSRSKGPSANLKKPAASRYRAASAGDKYEAMFTGMYSESVRQANANKRAGQAPWVPLRDYKNNKIFLVMADGNALVFDVTTGNDISRYRTALLDSGYNPNATAMVAEEASKPLLLAFIGDKTAEELSGTLDSIDYSSLVQGAA